MASISLIYFECELFSPSALSPAWLWPLSSDSSFQGDLPSTTLQPRLSSYNANPTMSLLLLKCLCLHDEVQSPLCSKRTLSRTFPENLGKVTGTLVFHRAGIPGTPAELLLLTSPATPRHRSQTYSQFSRQSNFRDPSTQLVILSLLVSPSL